MKDRKYLVSPERKKHLIKSINYFLKKHETTFRDHAKRLDQYFEMYCYNLIVDTYHREGYEIKIENDFHY